MSYLTDILPSMQTEYIVMNIDVDDINVNTLFDIPLELNMRWWTGSTSGT